MGYFSIGYLIFLILFISKVIRLGCIVQGFRLCRKRGQTTGISFKMKRLLVVFSIIGIFLFPSIIFITGTSTATFASQEININHINGENQGSPAIQLSFYATLSSYAYLTNETILRALNGTDFGGGALNPVEILLLVAEYELLDSANALKLAEMVNKCTQSGLRVWIWFVYNTSLYGHYPSYENYEHLPQFKQVFDNWVQNYSLSVYGLLFDNESDQEIMDTELSDIFYYLKVILQHRKAVQAGWSEAVEMYETIANNWSAQGYKIALVGMSTAILDKRDGDADIQQLFGIIDNPPDMWERMSFMLYRHCEYHTTPFGQDFLYNLAAVERKFYGERAVVALGCMSYPTYDTTNEILEDIAILKYLGYSTIELFEFKAFYEALGYAGLISILNSTLNGWKFPPFQVKFYSAEYLMWSALYLADILLNFF